MLNSAPSQRTDPSTFCKVTEVSTPWNGKPTEEETNFVGSGSVRKKYRGMSMNQNWGAQKNKVSSCNTCIRMAGSNAVPRALPVKSNRTSRNCHIQLSSNMFRTSSSISSIHTYPFLRSQCLDLTQCVFSLPPSLSITISFQWFHEILIFDQN